ncbi:hypothetical protein BH18ACT17_BH18ACT17_11830 [soil metagenome]
MKMWAHVGRAAAMKVVYGSPPDWNEMRAWERLLQPDELFIDVGANVGTYALWAAHLGCRVVAIEPDAETCRLLVENVALNPGARIAVRRTALTDHIGSVRMTTGLDSMNHLGDGPEVPATTLDAVIGDQDVAGVKIDVEGFEELVMVGAHEPLLSRRVRAFQLEWNDFSVGRMGTDRSGIERMLTDAGYVLLRPDMEGALRATRTAFGPDIFALRCGS